MNYFSKAGLFWIISRSLITAGVALCAVSFGLVVATQIFLHRSLPAQGRITSLETRFDSDSNTTNIFPSFEFADNHGLIHTIKSNTGTNPSKFAVEETVPVLYEPQHPERARIDTFTQVWFLPATMGTGGLAAAVIGLIVLRFSTRKNLQLT